jgi:hypothetical protein
MSKVVVNLRLDEDLVARVDAAAGPRGRTRWIVAAVEASLAPSKPSPPSKPSFAARYPAGGEEPRTESTHRVQRPQFVRATSLVTPEIRSEWEEIMAARQARLNKKRDGAA